MLHGHGDDIAGNVINFSSNVWKGGFSEKLKEHLISSLDRISRYPEVLATSLQEMIALHYNLASNQVLVTNGATEAIYLIAHAFAGKHTGIVYPTFSEYEDACNLFHHSLHFIEESSFHEDELFPFHLMFVCNPNNPTGKAYPVQFIEKILQNNPQTVFVIDEAYCDFTLTPCSSIKLISTYSNLILIKSLTKHFAIPGLRLGFLMSDSDAVLQIQSKKMPWSVNTLAIQAGKYIFQHLCEFEMPIHDMLEEKQKLAGSINRLKDFRVYPSDTTFFLCSTNQSHASLLKDYLYKNHSILIRDASNFKGLSPFHFRIASQMPHENQLLVNALDEWNRRNN